jgi:hypothetical protein
MPKYNTIQASALRPTNRNLKEINELTFEQYFKDTALSLHKLLQSTKNSLAFFSALSV